MKSLSLKNRALLYLRRQQVWVNGGELERFALDNGYKASNVSRRLRELENEGQVQRKIERGSVYYKAKPPVKVERYIIKGQGVGGADKRIEVPVYE